MLVEKPGIVSGKICQVFSVEIAGGNCVVFPGAISEEISPNISRKISEGIFQAIKRSQKFTPIRF